MSHAATIQLLKYNCGIKQGCKLALTLFGIYAAVFLRLGFKKVKHTCSIQIRFRYDGDFFTLADLRQKQKSTWNLSDRHSMLMIFPYLVTPECLQSLLTSCNQLANSMGMHINTTKMETMCTGNAAEFCVDGKKLAIVTHLKYLGSYVTSDCLMREEVTSRIQAVSCAFGGLWKRVFDSHDSTVPTKVAVYNQCLVQLLTYGSET